MQEAVPIICSSICSDSMTCRNSSTRASASPDLLQHGPTQMIKRRASAGRPNISFSAIGSVDSRLLSLRRFGTKAVSAEIVTDHWWILCDDIGTIMILMHAADATLNRDVHQYIHEHNMV